MDFSHTTLATESFSYSWLPMEPSSSRQILPLEEEASQNFDFNTSTSFSLVDADKLFLDGYIVPRFLDEARSDIISSSSSSSSTSLAHDHHRPHTLSSPSTLVRVFSGKYWSKFLVSKVLSKCIRCFISGRGSRIKARVNDVNISTQNVTSSPKRESEVYYDDESSIHEAILYCKNSIGTHLHDG